MLVGCRRKDGRVAIAICDTGPGIEPEFHQAIFREFYQLRNPERDRRKGLGLGLAIVDGLCRILDHPLNSSPGWVMARHSLSMSRLPRGGGAP